MEPSTATSARYERFNGGAHSAGAAVLGLGGRECVSSRGIAGKASGAVAALLSIYIIGYLTGYYIHRCT
uniref:Uncharacterized protein n=1 Tax=Salarias fasciatus TaxID=181472 RepID=A0A672GRN5_SALFA